MSDEKLARVELGRVLVGGNEFTHGYNISGEGPEKMAQDINTAAESWHSARVRGLVEALENYMVKFGDCGSVYAKAKESISAYREGGKHV